MRALALLLLLAPFAAAQDDPYLAEIREGVRAFEKGDLDQAVTRFARARQLHPKDWRGHAWQCMTQLRQASTTRDRARRIALAKEAKAVAALLVKTVGLRFSDPLYNYLTGLADSVLGRTAQAQRSLSRAYASPPAKFRPYAELGLQDLVARAFAHATMDAAIGLIFRGELEKAEPLLSLAERALPEGDAGWLMLHRNFAVIDEGLGRLEAAGERIEKCMALAPPALKTELLATQVILHTKNKKLKEARAVLAKLPAKSKNIEVVAARGAVMKLAAVRDPNGQPMLDALAFFREELKTYPELERYRLVEEFADLVLARVGRAQLKQERPLVDEAMALVKKEVVRLPECPGLYWRLHRLYNLLGDKESADKYKAVFEDKKKAAAHTPRYDRHGRPLCGA